MKSIVFALLCITVMAAQTTVPPQHATVLAKVDCSTAARPTLINLNDPKKNTVALQDAVSFVIAALNQATCQMGNTPSRFVLSTADIDLQTLRDTDGTLEVVFIGGLAGELDKSTTSELDFTYSVPAPINVPALHEEFLFRRKKVGPAEHLAALIEGAMSQLQSNLNSFPSLSQHQVKVSMKFAFTKDGTVEAEPKLGSVGITAKLKLTSTETQTLTLTFADQVPIVTMSVSPSPAALGTLVNLVATVLPPVNSAEPVNGSIEFVDGLSSLQAVPVQNGIATYATSDLAKGVHTLSAVFKGDKFDNVASSATILIVQDAIAH
jgi:hypothetical protein